MLVVPFVLGRYPLGGEIGFLHPVGLFERGDRLLDATGAPQHVSMHVQCVRDGWRQRRVRGTMLDSLVVASRVLVRVRQVVMRARSTERQRLFVIRNGRRYAALPAVGRVRRLGDAAEHPQLGVVRLRLERPVQGQTIRGEPGPVVWYRFRGHLGGARRDVQPVVIVRSGGELLRPRQCGGRYRRLVQFGVGDAQAGVRHGELWIQSQGLIERPCGLDPHVAMQIRQPLIVEGLRLSR